MGNEKLGVVTEYDGKSADYQILRRRIVKY